MREWLDTIDRLDQVLQSIEEGKHELARTKQEIEAATEDDEESSAFKAKFH
jgi:hypothetical protein